MAQIDLPAATTPAYVNFNAFDHVLARATLVPLAATK